MTVHDAYDKVIEYAWASVLLVFGYAWRVNERLLAVEKDQANTKELLVSLKADINGASDKIDRLIDKLL